MRPFFRKKLAGFQEDGALDFPAVLLIPRKLNEFEVKTHTGVSSERKLKTAYVDFDPGALLPVTPGSEAFLGSVVRDLAGAKPAPNDHWLHPASPLQLLRDTKCRSIVLLSDYAGSGKQITNYARALTRNPTIRSWRSGRLIKIHAVAFAASEIAVHNVSRDKYVDSFTFEMLAPSFSSSGWSEVERQVINRLCREYALPKRKNQAYGFKGSRGVFATDSTVPNNLPVILRQTGDGWFPFFDERVMPSDLLDKIVGYSPKARRDVILAESGQPRLLESMHLVNRSKEQVSLLTILGLASRRGHSLASIAGSLRLSAEEAQSLVAFLQSSGLLDDRNKATPLGLQELAMAKRKPRKSVAMLEPSFDPYYPKSLR
jgi:hypothetical protein